jgi:hypothetical protein
MPSAAGAAAAPPAAHRHRVLPAALREGLQGGVERSHIMPFAVDGALLLEVYVHDGIGTMVVDEKLEEPARGHPDDVGGILQLIEPFEKDGTLVKREPHRDRARHRQLHHHRARRRDLRLRRALPLPRRQDRRNGGPDRLAAKPGPGRRRKAAQAHRAARPRHGPGQHLRADHPHHALVHQARLRAGRPRLAARSAQAQVQLGPAQPGAGQETGRPAAAPDRHLWRRAQLPGGEESGARFGLLAARRNRMP